MTEYRDLLPRGANLRGADLSGANLRGADLRGAINVPPLPAGWAVTDSGVVVRDTTGGAA